MTELGIVGGQRQLIPAHISSHFVVKRLAGLPCFTMSRFSRWIALGCAGLVSFISYTLYG
jgi:hypothetical protein